MNGSAHLNNMDPTGSIKFTHEIETDNTIAFLDTLLERKSRWICEGESIPEEDTYQPVLGI